MVSVVLFQVQPQLRMVGLMPNSAKKTKLTEQPKEVAFLLHALNI